MRNAPMRLVLRDCVNAFVRSANGFADDVDGHNIIAVDRKKR